MKGGAGGAGSSLHGSVMKISGYAAIFVSLAPAGFVIKWLH